MLIAQISDLHVRPRGRTCYGTVDSNAMLERAVAHINALVPLPDLVVASGDLTDCGLDAEYEVLGEILSALTMPVYVVPGNHDRREPLRRVLGDRHPYLADGGEFLHFVVEGHPVRVIGLDSTIQGATHGAMCEARLGWLSAQLQAGAGQPTFLFLHHPPFSTAVRAMDAIGLTEGAAEFAALVRNHPEIERVVTGHHHRPIQTRWAGTLGVVAPSTAHQVALEMRPGEPTKFVMEPPGLALHLWEDGTMVTHLAPIGDFGAPFDVVVDPDYPGRAHRHAAD